MEPIFVFGSNREGRHGAGAALWAVNHRDAIYGRAEGPQGNAYAIVTKELRRHQPPVELEEIREGVMRFIAYAKDNRDLNFQVTEIGCGLAGFSPQQIAPFFTGYPSNVILPESFLMILHKVT